MKSKQALNLGLRSSLYRLTANQVHGLQKKKKKKAKGLKI